MDQAMKGAFETMGVKWVIPFDKDAKDYVGRNDFKDKKWGITYKPSKTSNS